MPRTHGVTVHILDAEAVAAWDGTPASVLHQPPVQIRELVRDFGNVGLVTAADGTDYVLCDQGVAWRADASLSSWMKMQYAPDKLPTRDLADYLHVFGARMESNFYLLHDAFTRPREEAEDTGTNGDSRPDDCRI